MSQTRSEVLTLLKQFDQEFTIFEGSEESFIFNLVRNKLSNEPQLNLDWQRLSKASFVLPYCHILSRQKVLKDVPAWFDKQAKIAYLHQISANEDRIEQIQELSQLFDQHNLKVLFIKGAAELAYCHNDVDFLGRRYMCDIDLLCATEDIYRVDQVLRSKGYELWDHQLKHWTRQEICKFTLNQHSHFIYNAYSKNYMELHGYVAVGANRASYPSNFEKLLLEKSIQVCLRGAKVWVPTPEHLITYSLCHAASKNNNQGLIYLDRFYLDEFAATDCAVSPPVLTNRRLDISQLRFLFQLGDLLDRFDRCINFSEVKRLVSQIADRDLIEMYTMISSYCFNERFPIIQAASLEDIKMCRQRYITRYMMPLLAEKIESIIASRLEKITSEFVEKQVENISVSIERRVTQRVTEQIIESMKYFMIKLVGKVFPKRFHKLLKQNYV